MSGIGAFLWIAYLAVGLGFAIELAMILVRRRNIERFLGDLEEEGEQGDSSRAPPEAPAHPEQRERPVEPVRSVHPVPRDGVRE